LRAALDNPPESEHIPEVALPALVFMKLQVAWQKDLADLVELPKRGRIAIDELDRYLTQAAPAQLQKWERVKRLAAEEE